MKKYHSYVLRVWGSGEVEGHLQPARRFVVETVSDTPHRWIFDSFPKLVAFLGQELREPVAVRVELSPPPAANDSTELPIRK